MPENSRWGVAVVQRQIVTNPAKVVDDLFYHVSLLATLVVITVSGHFLLRPGVRARVKSLQKT
jgi:hypothetical protein